MERMCSPEAEAGPTGIEMHEVKCPENVSSEFHPVMKQRLRAEGDGNRLRRDQEHIAFLCKTN